MPTDPSVVSDERHPLHTVTIHHERGRPTTHLVAECPVGPRSASIDECLSCGRSHGLALDPDGTVSVQCSAPPESRASTVEGLVLAIMSRDVICVRESVPVSRLREVLSAQRVSGLPVVDAHDRPVGIVSRADLLLVEDPNLTAGDVMTDVVFSLPEHATIEQAAAMMAYESVHRLPIVAPSGRIVGILSAIDVMRWLGRRAGYVLPESRARR